MTKAIRFHETGGPEVMKWEDVDVGHPGDGEVRIKHGAVGLNYIDVYFRTGLYPAPLPNSPGMEAAGVITEIGAGVTGFNVGDRVAMQVVPSGPIQKNGSCLLISSSNCQIALMMKPPQP